MIFELSKYGIVYVCNRDYTTELVVLDRDIEVDSQNTDIYQWGDGGGIYDKYWNWHMPLFVRNEDDNCDMIISKHGTEWKTETINVLRSLVAPISRTIIREQVHMSFKYRISIIRRIGIGSPVIIAPYVWKYALEASDVREFLISYANKSDLHAVILSETKSDENDIVIKSTAGWMMLYISRSWKRISVKNGKYQYYLTINENNHYMPIWLYGSEIKSNKHYKLEDLLWELFPYIRTRFTSIPLFYQDIDININI